MALEQFQLKPLPLIDPDPQVQRYLHFWATASDAEKQAAIEATRLKQEREHESKSE
ncbi:MAG TPA: hypothetical protein P5102_02860 [Candidatus Competibacteraceae bacterium]|nr:hypothetical protein [Candidatus Competibacteraceae bacterium]HRZ05086.1 hypothetical protein [Candidatus Competibacteraceae bacterium]HSA48120.1 hypothetical protein [Candidatus Competibacteraceae bacterium]